MATCLMVGLIILFDHMAITTIEGKIFPVLKLILLIAIGCFSYLSILLLIDSSILTDIKKLSKVKTVPITA
jgi:hypothetical protein